MLNLSTLIPKACYVLSGALALVAVVFAALGLADPVGAAILFGSGLALAAMVAAVGLIAKTVVQMREDTRRTMVATQALLAARQTDNAR